MGEQGEKTDQKKAKKPLKKAKKPPKIALFGATLGIWAKNAFLPKIGLFSQRNPVLLNPFFARPGDPPGLRHPPPLGTPRTPPFGGGDPPFLGGGTPPFWGGDPPFWGGDPPFLGGGPPPLGGVPPGAAKRGTWGPKNGLFQL